MSELDTFAIELPPEAAQVGAARLFAASLARHFGCDDEAVEDLKLAVSEACASAIRAREGGSASGPLRVAASREGDRLVFEVGGTALPPRGVASAGAPGSGDSGQQLVVALGEDLISSLFPDAEVTRNPGGGTDIRLTLLIPGESG